MTAPSPEFAAEFAFVCAAIGPARAEAVADAALDADTIAHIAHRHQVVPLVLAAIRRGGVQVPPSLARDTDPLAPFRYAREAVRLDRLLAAEGIEPLFLKGSALAILAYGSLGSRAFGDIDLLVRPDEAARATRILLGAGYRPEGDPDQDPAERIARLSSLAKDMVLHHADRGQIVELHWRMTDDPSERPVATADRQRVALVPGRTVATLGPEMLFAYLCGHGAAHGWARLRWLADVAALLANEPDGGERLWRAAVRRHRGRAAASAILLAERYLGTRPPPGFAPPRSLRLALLLRLSRRAIEAGGGTTDLARTRWRGWTETLAKLLVAERPGDVVGWTLRLLFSVEGDERVGTSPGWYVLHPLRRIPRLALRRHRRRMARAQA